MQKERKNADILMQTKKTKFRFVDKYIYIYIYIYILHIYIYTYA